MKLISLVALFLTSASVYASPVQYRFVGNAITPEIDFILKIDFNQDGFYIKDDGSIGVFGGSQGPFFVDYVSGNYSLAPSSSQFQRFYGSDSSTVEGTVGCVYALNSIGVCDYYGAVSAWYVGRWVELTLFDYMPYYYQTFVRIESISAVPIPGAISLFLSGLTFLAVFKKNITTSSGGRKNHAA